MEKYYVYYVLLDGVIVYIGRGIKSRYKHPLQGSSHVKEFNRLYYNNEVHRISSKVLCWFNDPHDCTLLEKQLIIQYKPKFNNDYLSNEVRLSCLEEEILHHFSERSNRRVSKKANFKKLAIEYVSLAEKCESNISQREYTECRERMQEILLCSDELARYVETLGYKSLSASAYVKKTLEMTFDNHCLMSNLRNQFIEFMSLTVNCSYTPDSLKQKIQQFYDMNGVSKNARVSDIDKVYNYKKTTLTGNISGIRILGVK